MLRYAITTFDVKFSQFRRAVQNMHKRWHSEGKPEFYTFSTTDDRRDVSENSSWQGAVELSMDTWWNSAEERARLMATNPSAEELLVANQEESSDNQS